MEQDVVQTEPIIPLDDDIDQLDEGGKKVFVITWCMIYSVLGFLVGFIIVALIPLYVPNSSVEVTQSTATMSDLMVAQFQTDYRYIGTRIRIKIDKRGLSKSVDQSFGFKIGVVVAEFCEFIQAIITDITDDIGDETNDKRRRRQDTTSEIGGNGTDLFNLYFRLQYPSNCFNNAACKKSAEQRYLSTMKESKMREMEVPLIDGQVLRFRAYLRSLTETNVEESPRTQNVPSTTIASPSFNTTANVATVTASDTISTENNSVAATTNTSSAPVNTTTNIPSVPADTTTNIPSAPADTTTNIPSATADTITGTPSPTTVTTADTPPATVITTTDASITTTTMVTSTATTSTTTIVTTTTATTSTTTIVTTTTVTTSTTTIATTTTVTTSTTTIATTTTVTTSTTTIVTTTTVTTSTTTIVTTTTVTTSTTTIATTTTTTIITTTTTISITTTTTATTTTTNSVIVDRMKFCAGATWNSAGTTFADSTTVGNEPYGIVIGRDNTIYVANRANSQIQKWPEGSASPTTISGGLNTPFSLAISLNNDIYIDNGLTNFRVDKFSSSGGSAVAQMYVCTPCFGLFVDISDNIHCSFADKHYVASKSLVQSLNIWKIVAGKESSGSLANELVAPRGIFVDVNLNLYVADFGNNRIQKFISGQLTGTTVAGSTSPSVTIALNGPMSVLVDGDGYLFIVDSNNHRIVASSSTGFRCVVGCSGSGGSLNTQLLNPRTMAFDKDGNILVADTVNSRIQKFTLATPSCVTVTTDSVPIATPPTYTNAISYNLPQFTGTPTWNPSATTLASSAIVGADPNGVFIDKSDTIYVPDKSNARVQVFAGGSTTPTRTLSGGLASPFSVFATTNGDVYVDNAYTYGRVDTFVLGSPSSTVVMNPFEECYGLFIDINNNLYCSMRASYRVMMKSLDSTSDVWIFAAGQCCAGPTANRLDSPYGIFVDTSLNLYVADIGNDRIQKFSPGQLDAITIATPSFTLIDPSGVVLDGNGYLYIMDSGNHRILAQGPSGFQCILGCSATSGATATQLSSPRGMAFDSIGNIFVADTSNYRIQKFTLTSSGRR